VKPVATAFVIDGAYFLRRFSRTFPHYPSEDAKAVAFGLQWLTFWHLSLRNRLTPGELTRAHEQGFRMEESADLYRIFFYDCPPLEKKLQYPISKRPLDLSRTTTAVFRKSVHHELRGIRKMALRFGRLNDEFAWRLKPDALKRLLKDPAAFDPQDEDFEHDIKQKGVDMRLGLDVASLAFKRQVDQIVMVAGDADFVPAAKLARREGIDVVLDPLGGHAARDLVEHVDGIRHCTGKDARMPVHLS
jgi:uncharacterized LabA/DUF88 family protein